MSRRLMGIAVFCAATLVGGAADAASNSETYISPDGRLHLNATITVPDSVDVDTTFDIDLLGKFVRGGGVNRFHLWRDAEWVYNANHQVVVTPGTGTLIDSDTFFFGGLDETITMTGGLPEGTYTFTLVFGRSFAHSLGDVGVDIDLTVGATTQDVSIDIKPRSCPNPINVDSNGVVSVAILGTADLDVEDVDLDTVLLEGVEPLRHAIEDAAAPFDPAIDTGCCTTRGPDGYDDLVFKFDKQELVDALGTVADGDELTLTLTGELLDGTEIEGADCAVIRKKKKKK